MAEKAKRKREEIDEIPTALDWALRAVGSVGSGTWRLTRATVRWMWNAAGWSAYQCWRAVRWSWNSTGRAIAWTASTSWAAIVWTWNLPGRIFRAVRGDNSDKPEIVRLIEGRYSRRFRFFSHLALYVIAVLLASPNWRLNQFAYQRDLPWIIAWGVIVLLHIIKFFVDEARDNALETALERGLWVDRQVVQGQSYDDRVARLSDDGELVYMVEDEKPKANHRPSRRR